MKLFKMLGDMKVEKHDSFKPYCHFEPFDYAQDRLSRELMKMKIELNYKVKSSSL